MKTKVILERFQSRCFPNSDDKVWKQWVDLKKREPKDLVELLSLEVRDTLKRRAVFLLLVPSAEYSGIYWNGKVGNFGYETNFLKTLNSNLLIYATQLIIDFYSMLMPKHNYNPMHYKEGGSGFTMYISVPDKYHDALFFYNNCILLLLTMVPEEQGKHIFSLFSLIDISTYWNMEEESGYNPFYNLLSSNVAEKWKKLADSKMKQIIANELTGNTKPREEWENALECYDYIIRLQLLGENLPYSVELFADQIRFLVSEEHYGKDIIHSSQVCKIYQILSADIYKDIRYRVAKFIIFGKKEEYSIWSEEILQGANMMLDEFSQDNELSGTIKLAIEEYEKKSIELKIESNKNKLKAQKTENNILEKMK